MEKSKKPLRVSFVYDDRLDGSEGVAQYIKTLGGWLMGRGHEVSYLVGETHMKDYQGAQVYSLAKNINAIFNGNRMSPPLPASGKKIRAALDKTKPDILHVQMPHSPFMAQKVVQRALPKTAVFGTFHILPSGKLSVAGSYVLRLTYLRGLRRFNEVVSVSQPAAVFAKKAFGIKSDVVPNLVDTSKMRTGKNTPDAKTIVFLGRLVERKGCRYLIDSFDKVLQTHHDAKLIIAGTGPDEENLKSYAKKLGITRSIEFVGFVDEQQKIDILSGAAIACFPSLYGESFGIVLIEAMAAGAGVVMGGANPGYSSVLEYRSEVLFDPKNIDEFSTRLLAVLDNKELKNTLHAWQADLVKKYDVDIVGRQIEERYYRAIANNNKKRHN